MCPGGNVTSDGAFYTGHPCPVSFSIRKIRNGLRMGVRQSNNARSCYLLATRDQRQRTQPILEFDFLTVAVS